MTRHRAVPPAGLALPEHWSPEQALAVFECLHAVRESLWALYGSQLQQAWCEQLMPNEDPPQFDPDEPF
jgi:hypothetical protein